MSEIKFESIKDAREKMAAVFYGHQLSEAEMDAVLDGCYYISRKRLLKFIQDKQIEELSDEDILAHIKKICIED